jgi:NADH:ubiquinone oxidoreductase subunit 3 (subunit A)
MIAGDLLFRPHRPNDLKLSTYECGEEAFGSSWIRFDMRFYSVALIFVVFDLEIAFLFPWASVYADPGLQGIVLIEGLVFIGILFLGLVYVWAKGDLDWIKAFSEGRAIHTGQHPADFSERRRALYEPDEPSVGPGPAEPTDDVKPQEAGT